MLPIPFVVLSTKVGPEGEVEKHVLTPFGDIDITVCMVSMEGVEGQALDIKVGEGIDCWMLAGPGVLQFRNALVGFVSGMVRQMLGAALAGVGQLCVELPGEDRKICIPWKPVTERSVASEAINAPG